jgi:beta-lactamase superfamily II metal-dependent hydrolase
MTYEVDIRAVGEESQSGDAIAIRYGNLADRRLHRVIIIDGGFKENGDDLVGHVRGTYGTDHVDLVVSTHPDQDHASGLRVVLEELTVGELWLHRPWMHSRAVAEYVNKGIAGDLDEMQKRSVATAQELEAVALQKGVPITEPFTGTMTNDGVIQVLGPTQGFYEQLLVDLVDKEKSQSRQMYEAVKALLAKAVAKLRETWDSELLVEPDPNATSPRNNTSTILLARLDGDRFLFTGDAGVPAFENAAMPTGGLNGLKYFQVPHHGSKRNVGPRLLDAILGPKLGQGQVNGKSAFISAAKKGHPKHPSRRVVNAAIRRGAHVTVTKGSNHRFASADAPAREGWGPITPEGFSTEYDD